MKKIYSVLTCIFGDYEYVREIINPNPLVEYILVTDNKDLKSNTWEIKVLDIPLKLDNASKSAYVKYHPFSFISTDTMIWLDGSVQILDDFTKDLMSEFILSDYHTGEMINLISDSARKELLRWKIGWGSEEKPDPFYKYNDYMILVGKGSSVDFSD